LFFTNNQKGEILPAIRINQIINERTKLTRIKKIISPHTFRRSFATLLNNKGAQLTTIQKLLGHSKLETTVSYIHNNQDYLLEDYSKL